MMTPIPMTTTATVQPATPGSMSALKARLKATWMAGDYDYFSRYMAQSAVEFLDRIPIQAGSTLLDVACGSGQLALAAARKGIQATGVDIATNSIHAARMRVVYEGPAVEFDEGDVEDLTYADGSFDAVATLFGAMFAPRPELAASEMMRVVKPGGLIAMANWTAQGFIGKMFKVISGFVEPPKMPSPLMWGDEATVAERFGMGVKDLRMKRVSYTFDYPFPPAEVVEFFRQYYGPANLGFASLGASEAMAMRSELEKLWSSHNTGGKERTVVPSEYLEVVARRA